MPTNDTKYVWLVTKNDETLGRKMTWHYAASDESVVLDFIKSEAKKAKDSAMKPYRDDTSDFIVVFYKKNKDVWWTAQKLEIMEKKNEEHG